MAALLLVGMLLWPSFSTLIQQPLFAQPDAGFLPAVLTLDGGAVQQADALVYGESGRVYLSAAELGRRLGLTTVSGSFRGHQALLVYRGEARAAYLDDGRLLTFTEGHSTITDTTSVGRPLLLMGQWLIPLEQVAVGFLCLPSWDGEENCLTLASFVPGLEQTVALAESYGLTLQVTGDPAADRYLLDRVLPARSETGETLLDRALGPLLEPTALRLSRSSYGFLQVAEDGLYGLFSTAGVQLLAPQYKNIDFFDPDSGTMLTTDRSDRQRLWRCTEGGILSLTESSYRSIGRGYLRGGGPADVTLLGHDLVAVSDDMGLWGLLSLQTGRLTVPCRYNAIGAHMEVGSFSYSDGNRTGRLAGQQEQPTIFFEGRQQGVIVDKDGLLGVVGFFGETIFYPAYDAIFLLPSGDRPGWYGRQGDHHILMQSLPMEQLPILEGAELLSLSGASLLLLQRMEGGWWAADMTTGSTHLLSPEVAIELFADSPVLSAVQATLRGQTLQAGNYPQPPYVSSPVMRLREDQSPEQGAADYPALFLSRMTCSGGRLGLTDFSVEECHVELGDRKLSVRFTCTVTPQADALDLSVGGAWGTPGDDGRCRLTLQLRLCEAVDGEGHVLLCAIPGESGQAVQGLPAPRGDTPVYRYDPPKLERLYTELLQGAVEERVFYENEDATYIEARRLVREDGTDHRTYHSEILRLSAGSDRTEHLFSMPLSLGSIKAVAETSEGLLVSSWQHLFASSGQDGDFGLLTQEGFLPLLEQAQVLGMRDGLVYVLARSPDHPETAKAGDGSVDATANRSDSDGDGSEALSAEPHEGLLVVDTADLSIQMLAPLPIGSVGRHPQLQAITRQQCILALPTPGRPIRYRLVAIDRQTGEVTELYGGQ